MIPLRLCYRYVINVTYHAYLCGGLIQVIATEYYHFFIAVAINSTFCCCIFNTFFCYKTVRQLVLVFRTSLNYSKFCSALLLVCRNDAGILVRTERLRTKDITQKVKAKNYWQVLQTVFLLFISSAII